MKRVLIGCLLLAGCGVDDPEILGAWKNRSGQQLIVGGDMSGQLTQAATCTPQLIVFIERDPFDGYAIRFEPSQRIFYPPAQQQAFFGESFCSSKKSVPMCRFCQIDGAEMICESPEQEIVGSGAGVVHDCNWVRSTATSTAPAPGCRPSDLVVECVPTSTSAR